MRSRPFAAAIAVAVGAAALAGGSAGAARSTNGPRGTLSIANVDVSQRHFNESEEAVTVNPTNPQNVVIVTNVDNPSAGMFEGVTFDGGSTWATSLIGNNDNLGAACCDPTLSFDQYGNLFLSYLYNVGNVVPVALSTDGGLHFNVIANIAKPASSTTQTSEERRGLFRFVDQPTIIAAHNEVWLVFNAGGPMVATGAPVTGLGQVGGFLPIEVKSFMARTTAHTATWPSGRRARSCRSARSPRAVRAEARSSSASIPTDWVGPGSGRP